MAKEPHGCPLCGQKCATHDDLQKHIAREMQQLALFVVPSEYFDNESSSEVESSEEDYFSLATRVKFRLRRATQLDKNADYVNAVRMYESAIGLYNHRGSHDPSKNYIRELVEAFTERVLHIKAFLNNRDPIVPFSETSYATYRLTTHEPILSAESSSSSSPSKADHDADPTVEQRDTPPGEDHPSKSPDLELETEAVQHDMRESIEGRAELRRNPYRRTRSPSYMMPDAQRIPDIESEDLYEDDSWNFSELSARNADSAK